MKMMYKCLAFCGVLSLSSCISDKDMIAKMKKALKDDPSILTDAIKENPAEFVTALQEAARDAREVMAKKKAEDDKKKLEKTFENPLKPKIREDESIRGTKGAPLVLVEYSDFECPFCTRGYKTVQDLLKQYKGKIQFIYKHLPLSFHQAAMPAAKYYEALRLQSEVMAFKFHDEIFANQGKLKKGEGFLKSVAKKLGANMSKLAKDVKLKSVEARIKEDMKEAGSFGIQGTPGFLINGIPVKGAYPAAHFNDIIEKLKEKGMVKL